MFSSQDFDHITAETVLVKVLDEIHLNSVSGKILVSVLLDLSAALTRLTTIYRWLNWKTRCDFGYST